MDFTGKSRGARTCVLYCEGGAIRHCVLKAMRLLSNQIVFKCDCKQMMKIYIGALRWFIKRHSTSVGMQAWFSVPSLSFCFSCFILIIFFICDLKGKEIRHSKR